MELIIFFAVFAGLMLILARPKQPRLSPEEKFQMWVERVIYSWELKEALEIKELEELWKGEVR
jgi:hypothetical protein